MEVYFAATGPLHWLNLFETTLEAQTFAIEGLAPNGQRFTQEFSGLIEPVNLYRFITTKESMPLALRTLLRNPNPLRDKLGLPIFALRKVLGLKPIPEDPSKNNWQDGPILKIPTTHINIVPIGIKDDEVGIVPTTGTYQEKI